LPASSIQPICLINKLESKSGKIFRKLSKSGTASLELSFPHVMKNSVSTKRLNKNKKEKNSSIGELR
jgi:transposase-like protein